MAAGASFVSLKDHYQEANVNQELQSSPPSSTLRSEQDAYFWMVDASKVHISCREHSLLFSTGDEFVPSRKLICSD